MLGTLQVSFVISIALHFEKATCARIQDTLYMVGNPSLSPWACSRKENAPWRIV